jgi:sulfite oxidase
MKSPAFRTITESPLNGAPLPSVLMQGATTGTGEFFVRNHGGIGGRNEFAVRGMVRSPIHEMRAGLPASLADLPRRSVEATLQCAGNRRTSLQKFRPIPNEVPWPSEAISNAMWEGVSLADVLHRTGVLDGAAHVWFLGSDELTGKHAGEQFGASIPLAKALSGSVLLADTMNGAPLPAEHGAPLRALVPGYIGARSVKWLTEVRVEREPTPNYFQQAYSVFPPSMLAVPPGNVGGVVLGEFPLSSAFGGPGDGDTMRVGTSTVCGWAIVGGDRVVTQLQVSSDGGATWMDARFTTPAKRFVWRLWEADITLAPGEHELVCRAFDDAGGTQPDDVRTVWNVKGYANNSWDRITVRAI